MPASNNDQPRDENGQWVAEGGAHRKQLQEKHSSLLDRLEKEDAPRPAYGTDGWEMGKGGYDTRGQGEIKRPLVLGEVPHPQDKNTRVPVVMGEGEQDTTKPDGAGFGRRHIEFRHGQDIRNKGFKSVPDYLSHVIENHDLDLVDEKHNSRVLAIKPQEERSKASTPMVSTRAFNSEAPNTPLPLIEHHDHYSIGTGYPARWRDVKKLPKVAEDSASYPLSAQHDLGHKVVHPFRSQRSHERGQGENSPPSAPKILHDASSSFQAKPLYPPAYFQALHASEAPAMDDNVQAAGRVYTAQGRVLLLKRPDGAWGIVAGACEGGETAQQTAIRESVEEVGRAPEGKTLWSVQMPRSDGPGDFRAYAVALEQDFTPSLNDEHTGWGWFEGDKLPSPLFPGTADILDRFTIDMGAMCRKMAEGKYTSPQRFMNVTLFAMRISGTGWAYRNGERREYTYRNRDDWLTPEVMEACQGMPVVLNHPDEAVITDRFYRDRSVGSVVYPFIKNDELWAITRIQDRTLATLLSEVPWSTSPGVISGKDSISRPLGEDGTTLLLEGTPYHPDHLAIVSAGVWDKYGPPSGIDAPPTRQHGDTPPMAELKEALPSARDALATHCTTAHKDAQESGDADKSAFFSKLLEELDKIKGLIEGATAAQHDAQGNGPPSDDTALAEKLLSIAQQAGLAEPPEAKADEDTGSAPPMPSNHIPGNPQPEQTDATQDPAATPADREGLADELIKIAQDTMTDTLDKDKAEKDTRHDAEKETPDEGRAEERRDGTEPDAPDRAEEKKDRKDGAVDPTPDQADRKDEGNPPDMLAKMVDVMRKGGADDAAIAQCITECGGDPQAYLPAESEENRRIREQLAEMDRRDKERRDELEEVKSRTKPLSDEEHNEISELQSHTDAVAQPLGVQTPRYVPGETVAGYRRRCAELLKPHSKEWATTNLADLPPEVFAIASRQIHKDAQDAASRPVKHADKEPIRAVRQRNESGHSRTDYRGSFRSGFGPFMA